MIEEQMGDPKQSLCSSCERKLFVLRELLRVAACGQFESEEHWA